MSDPATPGAGLNVTQAIGLDVTRRLNDKGVPEAKHAAKITSALVWWPIAGLALAAIALLLVGMFRKYQDGQPPTVVVAVIFLAIPLLVLLYAVKKADGEVLTSFLGSLVTLGKGAREAVKGS